MSKKHFIALADYIKAHNDTHDTTFNEPHIRALAHFCAMQNPRFNRERWLAYIAGECGPNGGRVKREAQ